MMMVYNSKIAVSIASKMSYVTSHIHVHTHVLFDKIKDKVDRH